MSIFLKLNNKHTSEGKPRQTARSPSFPNSDANVYIMLYTTVYSIATKPVMRSFCTSNSNAVNSNVMYILKVIFYNLNYYGFATCLQLRACNRNRNLKTSKVLFKS